MYVQRFSFLLPYLVLKIVLGGKIDKGFPIAVYIVTVMLHPQGPSRALKSSTISNMLYTESIATFSSRCSGPLYYVLPRSWS